VPSDRDLWCELKRHIVRMKDALDLVERTVRMEPLLRNTEMGSKLEGLARFALGEG